jgi:hypothetical protein
MSTEDAVLAYDSTGWHLLPSAELEARYGSQDLDAIVAACDRWEPEIGYARDLIEQGYSVEHASRRTGVPVSVLANV